MTFGRSSSRSCRRLAGNGRKPIANRRCLHALLYVLASGIGWGVLAQQLPQLQDHPTAPPALAGTRLLPHSLETIGRTLPAPARDQLGSGPPRRLQEAVPKGGEATGPSPVDRSKVGTALHLACDSRAMPLGVVLSGDNANDGVQTKDVLQALVVRPLAPERPAPASRPAELAHGPGGWGVRQRPDAAAGARGRFPDASTQAG
jgi:hypothetical protein